MNSHGPQQRVTAVLLIADIEVELWLSSCGVISLWDIKEALFCN
jgi:hypothetical protein